MQHPGTQQTIYMNEHSSVAITFVEQSASLILREAHPVGWCPMLYLCAKIDARPQHFFQSRPPSFPISCCTALIAHTLSRSFSLDRGSAVELTQVHSQASACSCALPQLTCLHHFCVAVYPDGSICLDIIQEAWSPIHNICTLLTSIQSLLTDPNCASPANPEAAKVYTEDRTAYNK